MRLQLPTPSTMRWEDNFIEITGGERMERSVEVLAIILFGVWGLSHILQHKAWAAGSGIQGLRTLRCV